MTASAHALRPATLTAGAFAEFGEVIEASGASGLINDGTTRQFADLAIIDVAAEGGRPRLSIYRTTPYELPLAIAMLERHPLSSQLFMPLSGQAFLMVVAPAGSDPDPQAIRAFVTNGRQGINYRRGTWHHPLIALAGTGDFLVVDREGEGRNCDEFPFGSVRIMLQLPGR
jgi:ureidoglycolate lyase